ncbi:hypothetical protein ACFLSS_03045 [Bacteroidota bacterium]
MGNSRDMGHHPKRVLTIREIQKSKGFENFSDEQADELSKFLYILSEITYKIYCDEKKS